MVADGLALALRSTASGARNKVLILADKLLKRMAAGTQAALQQLRQQQRRRRGEGGARPPPADPDLKGNDKAPDVLAA